MVMKKILLISLIAIAILASVSVVSAGWFDGLGGSSLSDENGLIKIECNNSSISGTLYIHEFKNIAQDNNTTAINASEFYDDSGLLDEGIKNSIKIKDGKAEYQLHNDTEFFSVDYFIENINPSDADLIINVKYLSQICKNTSTS